jgi:hypothetical protein
VADESDYANEDDAIEFEPKKEKRKRGRPKKTEAEKAATREGNAKRRNGIKAIAKGEDDGSGGGEESEDEDGDEGGGGEESRYETRVLVRSRLSTRVRICVRIAERFRARFVRKQNREQIICLLPITMVCLHTSAKKIKN